LERASTEKKTGTNGYCGLVQRLSQSRQQAAEKLKKRGSSGIRVGDFDSNLLKKLGLNSWCSEEKQRG
jgi:hypothetical protein